MKYAVLRPFWRILGVIACLGLTTVSAAQTAREPETSAAIREVVGKQVAEKRVPGMVAAIADANGLIGIGAAGVRKAGSDAAMTAGDLVHIGSCTKAMTSTVLATLVSEGLLHWDAKLVETISGLKSEIDEAYHDATLWELVTHRAQFPANAKSWWSHADLELKDRRLAHLKESLRDAPTAKPGEYVYSNLGYVAAGCMAEAVTGQTWETLIQARLFEPLGMASAGFGPPGTTGGTDQPWGHVKARDGWTASQLDNPEALGPAGRVHCTLEDWAKFAALQLTGTTPAILTRDELDRLIVPTDEYAAGWGVVERGWADGIALTHSGSNTMWYATVWIAPKRDRIYLVATNVGGEIMSLICDRVISELIQIDSKRPAAE